MPSGSFHIPRRQTSEQVEALFASARTGDPLGVRIQAALAMVACFLAGGPTSFVDWSALPVLICFFVRMTGQHRILEPLAFDRVLRLLLLWGAWLALSVLWSAGRTDPATGASSRAWLTDFQTLRFLPLAVLLWPSMDRRSWLTAALMAGIACGQVSQLLHLLKVETGFSLVPFARAVGRISGWWDPVSGGTVLCAGLGLWLGPALFGVGRARLIGALGVAATLVCIVLTGTRGAWIGAALLCGIAVIITAWRIRPRSRVLVPIAIAAALAVLAGGAAYLAAGPKIADRLHRGIDEVRDAIQRRDYSTDTGLRIAMWQWAVAASREHPFAGVGAGGYQPWVRSQSAESATRLNAPAEAITRVHAQAHSWYLHTLSTLGVIGLGLLGALAWSAVQAGLRPRPSERDGSTGLWISPALALIGLAGAGLFDTITVNQQPAFMFYLLIALCLPSRPREAT